MRWLYYNNIFYWKFLALKFLNINNSHILKRTIGSKLNLNRFLQYLIFIFVIVVTFFKGCRGLSFEVLFLLSNFHFCLFWLGFKLALALIVRRFFRFIAFRCSIPALLVALKAYFIGCTITDGQIGIYADSLWL